MIHMSRKFVELSDIIAEDIEAGGRNDPKGFMRKSRLRSAFDVVAGGIVSLDDVQKMYGIVFTPDEQIRAQRLYEGKHSGD